MQNIYEFAVHDPDGYWGDLRQASADQESAEAVCREYLVKHQCEPNGSLVMPFCLELRTVKRELVTPRKEKTRS